MLLLVLLVSVSLLHAQRPLSDSLTDGHLNKVFCVSNGQCADDEVCEKLCLWTHPNGWFVGCKVLCVKRSRDAPRLVFETPTTSFNPQLPTSTRRPSLSTTSISATETPQITDTSKANGPPVRFGSDFLLNSEENDLLTEAESGDGPFDDDELPDIGLKFLDDNRVSRQDACPAPKICEVNCGIVINEAGCQDCQCVWQGAKCTTDAECKAQEYCEDGGCWCKDGFRQSISQKGVCEPIEEGGAPPISRPKPTPSIDGNVTVSLIDESIQTTPSTSEDKNQTSPSVEITIAPKPLPPTDESATPIDLFPPPDDELGPSPSDVSPATGTGVTSPSTVKETVTVPVAPVDGGNANPPTDESATPPIDLFPPPDDELGPSPSDVSPATGTGVTSPSTVKETVTSPVAPVDGGNTAAPVPTEQYGAPPNAKNVSPSNSVALPELPSGNAGGPPIDLFPPPDDELGPSSNEVSPATSTSGPAAAGGLPVKKRQFARSLRDPKRQNAQIKAARSITSAPIRHWPGPCTHHHQCPPNLYCIFGDCWHLPNKPVRIRQAVNRQRDEAKSVVPPVGLRRARPFQSSTQKTTTSSYRIGEQNYTIEILPPGAATTASTFHQQSVSGVSLHWPAKRLTTSSRKKELGSGNIRPEIARKAFGVATDARVAVGQWIPADTLKLLIDVRRTPEEAPSTVKPSSSQQNDEGSEAVKIEQMSTRPVFVAVQGAKKLIRDECIDDRQCGPRYICCRKKWCDLTVECGAAKFCLPNCWATKTTYLNSTSRSGQPLIDIVYD